jgi:twitching motility protein PilT
MKIHDLFDLVAKEKASDLLISSGAPPILRINGELFRSRTDALTPEDTEKLIFEFLTQEQKDRFERDKELDFSLAVGRKHRFRVNVYLQKGAITAAFRPIPEDMPSLEDLGLPKGVAELTSRRQGLVLVTGPTGHGKTTTLAALIDKINNERACHIITVEDPIEYVHSHKRSIVDQREVGGDTHAFKTALKYVLRQDPDVILVGEMRDLETIQAALTAAETGHLVFATLHTNDAIQTVRPAAADTLPAFDGAAGNRVAAAIAPRRPAGPRAGGGVPDEQRRHCQPYPRCQDPSGLQRGRDQPQGGDDHHGPFA